MNHKHIIVNAAVRRPPTKGDEHKVADWMRRLVDAVGMQIVHGPLAYHCGTDGNEGVTAACIIETSHCSIHIWEKTEPPVLKFDLYSCADFTAETVLGFVKEFDPIYADWIVIDRNNGLTVTEEKTECYEPAISHKS